MVSLISFKLCILVQFAQCLPAKTVHSLCDCNSPSIQLYSLPSGFLIFSTCACIRPCPNRTIYMIVFQDCAHFDTLPNYYMHIFGYMLASGACPNTIIDLVFFVILLMCFHQILAQIAQTMNAYHYLWIRKLMFTSVCLWRFYTVAFYICIIRLHQASTRTVKYTQCLIHICWKFSVCSVPIPQPPPCPPPVL